ncbi:MAG: hypothetical protein MJA32_09275 [Proteobacteria bacterium]|nr:hypothetical protein [Pseudomonadota bacterium]
MDRIDHSVRLPVFAGFLTLILATGPAFAQNTPSSIRVEVAAASYRGTPGAIVPEHAVARIPSVCRIRFGLRFRF